MENLKIRVTTEQESKEAQELFFELGCHIDYPKKCLDDAIILFSESCGLLTYSSTETYTNDGVAYKEITLQELRDMVVLKRNDKSDASHVNENTGELYRVINDVWHVLNEKWEPSSRNGLWIMAKTKPIKEESLNNKIATAEVARQEEKHSHYKKDVSHLNVIDPYRIADLYNLHPCADHIMKKSLCAGNRGHKDTLRDIQDIIDTAERWKQMIEEDSSEI